MFKIELSNRNRVLTAVLLLVVALGGCVVGPKYHPPKASVPAAPDYKETPANFKDADGWKVASPQDAMLRGNWWEIFNEPELNDLEKQLNVDNQNIRVFFENYLAARAVIRETRAQYFPTVSVGVGYTRSGTSASSGAGTATGGNNFTLPIDASWAPDLFGRIRNAVSSARAAAQVSAADLENERLLEQATLAETFFQIRGQDQLQSVLNETVKADEEVLKQTQSRYDLGLDNQVSVEQATQTLESARASATNVGIARAQYEHAIATLLGKNASDFSIPVRPLIAAPPAIPTGTPSQLLERRPDVASAERKMAEANAVVGIGHAAYYPSLTLSASAGLTSSSFSKLFTSPNRVWSIGPSLSETIFDGGLRRATLNQSIAIYNADIASYRETVLAAFQQVEDYLAQTRLLAQEIQQEQAATDAAQRAFELEQVRYDTGIDPYLTLLSTQTALLQTRQTLVNLHVQQMSGSILLVEALGGGWDRTQLPSSQQVSEKPASDQPAIQP